MVYGHVGASQACLRRFCIDNLCRSVFNSSVFTIEITRYSKYTTFGDDSYISTNNTILTMRSTILAMQSDLGKRGDPFQRKDGQFARHEFIENTITKN